MKGINVKVVDYMGDDFRVFEAASDSGAVLKVAKCTYREASGVQGTFNTSQRFKLTTEDYDPSNIIALAGVS